MDVANGPSAVSSSTSTSMVSSRPSSFWSLASAGSWSSPFPWVRSCCSCSTIFAAIHWRCLSTPTWATSVDRANRPQSYCVLTALLASSTGNTPLTAPTSSSSTCLDWSLSPSSTTSSCSRCLVTRSGSQTLCWCSRLPCCPSFLWHTSSARLSRPSPLSHLWVWVPPSTPSSPRLSRSSCTAWH